MLRSLKALCLYSLASAVAAFAATTSDPLDAGDIVVGFYTDSGTGATQNLIVNLGGYTRFEAGDGATISFDTAIIADLVATYGADWNNRSDLYWTVTGATYATSINGLTRNTIFSSSPRSALQDAPLPINSAADGALAAVRVNIQGIRTTFNSYATTANNPVAVVVEGSNPDSLYARQQTSNTAQFGPGNANSVVGTSVSDFYGIVPTSGGIAPSGLSTDSTGLVWARGTNYLGYFKLSATGLTFTSTGAVGPAPQTAPSFTVQPIPQTVLAGANVTFTASVSGNPTPTLQWYKGDSPLNGQTSATLNLSNVQLSDAGDYTLRATNSSAPNGIASSVATLTVRTLPVFTTQPASQTVNAGGNVTLTVAVSGTPTPTLQWFKGADAIPGRTSPSLSLTGVQAADSGDYKVVATNAAAPNGVSSSIATLTVNVPGSAPVFTTQPVSRTVSVGTNVTFTASVSGNPTPTLQWYKGDSPLNGQTSATLNLSNVQVSDAGDYTLRAANGVGGAFVASAIATLTVDVPAAPSFTVQPIPQTVLAGANVTFTASVSGNPTPTLQWYKGDSPLNGQTSATLSLSNVQLSDAGDYTLRATNSSAPNGIASSVATLTVRTLPVFTTQPASQTVNAGGNVTLTVVVSGTPTPTLQWFKGADAIPGRTSPSLSLTGVQAADSGDYKVVATNAAAPNGVSSSIATLTVNVPDSAPVFTSSPASQTVNYGAALTLSCAVTGKPAPNLVWRKDKTILAGQTSPTLVISPVKLTDAGVYTVTATNASANAGVVSTAATVKVIVPSPAAIATPVPLCTGSQVEWDLSGGRPVPAGLVFNASGLPAGLALNSATGRITGVITANAGSAKVSTWAQVGSVKSAVNNITLSIGAFPAAFTGSYEALLFADESSVPAAKVALTVAAGGTFTGTLLADEVKAFALKGRLVLAGDNASASVQLALARGNLQPYALKLSTGEAPVFSAVLSVGNTRLDSGDDGIRLLSAAPAGAASAYTLLLASPANLGRVQDFPQGLGWATASINAKGELSLSGKTADATKLIGTFSLGADNAYRVFIKPYAEAGGSLAGSLPLSARTASPSGWHVAPGSGSDLYWVKPVPAAATTNYADGFGPIGLDARLEPWTKPATALPLRTLLRLGETGALSASFSASEFASSGSNPYGLPSALTLGAANAFTVTNSDNVAQFSARVTPGTGAVTGSFTLKAIPPLAARKVPFDGVLLQTSIADESGLIGGGFFLVPAPTAGGPVRSGAIVFSLPSLP